MMYDMLLGELMRHKLRTGLTITGVAIGILLIVSLGSFSEGIKIFVDQQLAYSSGLITVIKQDISFEGIMYSKVDENVIDELADIPGIEDISGFVMGTTPEVGWFGGIDFSKVDMFSSFSVELDEGRTPEEGADEVVLGYKAAERLDAGVGDSLKIGGRSFEVVGIYKEMGTEDDDSVITTLAKAQDVLGMDGEVTMIIIKPEDVSEARSIADFINDEYGDSEEIKAGTDEDVRKFAEQLTDQMSAMTFAMGSIASFIAGIVIMNVMFMAVRERRREIGVMKAVGATNRHILIEIMAESLAITFAGSVAGLVLSVVVVQFINGFLGGSFTAVITPSLALESTAFLMAIGALAGMAPARQASRLNPIEAIRYE